MNKHCQFCRQEFQVTEMEDRLREKCSPIFNGKKYLFPAPEICSNCRYMKRLSYRNERNLYHRKCDLTGKQIISIYSADKPYKVYSQDEWWGDSWDAKDYGRDFDFSRTFFDQFHELRLAVPRVAITNHKSVNSEFTNQSENNKNCYMLTSSGHCEDCLYGHWMQAVCRYCVDCLQIKDSELCYECINVSNGYDCNWIENAQNCNGCSFGYDLIGCSDCLGCVGLRNKKYCVLNEEVGKEEYEKIRNLVFSGRKSLEEFRSRFENFKARFPRKYVNGYMLENATGDYIHQAKNSFACFNCTDIEDCMYMQDAWKAKDCLDVTETLDTELGYELHGSAFLKMTSFTSQNWQCSDSFYCDLVFENRNIFGCVGLKYQKYCIFNKQFAPEEYSVQVSKIIEHMQKTPLRSPSSSYAGQACEWGQFFPMKHSMFGYNESVASEYFPLSREQASGLGLQWFELEEKAGYQGPNYVVPDSIVQVGDDILDKVLICEVTGKPYRIIKQELKFYRQKGLPIPVRSFMQRHHDRMAKRNTRVLWERECMKCGLALQTSYSPESKEMLYCERCYHEAL